MPSDFPLTIGVLGGLGPQTTIYFLQCLLKHCQRLGAVEDHDFPALVVRSAGHPALTERGISDMAALQKHLTAEIQALENAGAQLIGMPCNTIHCYYDELQTQTSSTILDMTALTLKKADDQQLQRLGLLATKTTIDQQLYTTDVVTPDSNDQTKVEQAIRQLMADPGSQVAADLITAVSSTLIEHGADAIILGCTELGLAAMQLHIPVPVLDSVDILAEAAAEYAYNGLPGTATATTKTAA